MTSTLQMQATMMNNKNNNNNGCRIPASLKAVFLASNGGQDVSQIQAPPAAIAMQTFESADNAAQRKHDEMMRTLLNMNAGLTIREDTEAESEEDYEDENRVNNRFPNTAGQNGGDQMRVVSMHQFEQQREGSFMSDMNSSSNGSFVNYATLFESNQGNVMNGSIGNIMGGPASAMLENLKRQQQQQQIRPNTPSRPESQFATNHQHGSAASLALSASLALLNETGKKDISPQDYLEDILTSRGYSTKKYAVLQTAYYNKPTELQLASYDKHLIELVRRRDLTQLREIFKAGISLNPCNTHCESLIHTVSRLGFAELLQFLVSRGSSLAVSDDYGRTPMHDACWTVTPNFPVVEIILRKDRRLVSLMDARGTTPFTYIPKDSWPAWIDFLDAKKDLYWPYRGQVEVVGEEPAPSLVLQQFNSKPIKDPPNALKPRLASMLVSGKMSVKEIEFLRSDEATMSIMTLDFDGGEWDSDLESEFDSDEDDYTESMCSDDEDDDDESEVDDMSLAMSCRFSIKG